MKRELWNRAKSYSARDRAWSEFEGLSKSLPWGRGVRYEQFRESVYRDRRFFQ